jgi:hypothetical protein
MAGQALGLKDDEYWTDPWKNLAAVSWDRVDRDVAGILLDVPAVIPLDQRESLPALVYHSAPTEELWRAPFLDHGIVTAVRIEDDAFFAAKAMAQSGPDAEKGPQPSQGFAGEEYGFDLRETLGMEWEPGTLWVTALLRDRASERIRVRMGSSPSAYQDPEVRKFLEAERAKLPQRAPMIPREIRMDSAAAPFTPPAGETTGIRMKVGRVIVAQARAEGRLDVGYRLPIRATDVSQEPKALIKGLPPVTAVVALSLLVIGSEKGVVIPIRMLLPSFDAVETEGELKIAKGSFTMDLFKIPSIVENPQTFFIYAFSGALMAGAATVGVVAEDALPGRAG